MSRLVAIAAFASSWLFGSQVLAAEYFLDDQAGSDANPGTSSASAWKTLDKLAGQPLAPGDTVRFRAGGTWDAASLGTNGLLLQTSGAAGKPITLTPWGTGARPTIVNSSTASKWIRAITLKADFVVIRGLRVAKAFEIGIAIEEGADDNLIEDCEADDVGLGVVIRGSRNHVTKSFFHDLHMVNNTQGGDDDYGAVAIDVEGGSGNEISFNRMERCIAPSYDYVNDGGAVEIYAGSATTTVEGLSVHHNFATDGEGFLELGGQGGTIKDARVFYNVSVGNRLFNVVHNGGTFAVKLEGFRVENNTVIETKQKGSGVVWFNTAPSAAQYAFRNNLVYVGEYDRFFSHDGFSHDHNLFFAVTPMSNPGITFANDELTSDPKLVDVGKGDYHLAAESPAIDAAASLGHTADFDGNSVPYGSAPDIGAFEHAPASSGGTAGAPAGGSAGVGGSAGAGGSAGSGGAAGSSPMGSDSSDEGGCGCRAVGRESAGAWLVVLAALAALGRRRRQASSLA